MLYSLSVYSLYSSSISRELATVCVVLFVFYLLSIKMMCIMCGYHKKLL